MLSTDVGFLVLRVPTKAYNPHNLGGGLENVKAFFFTPAFRLIFRIQTRVRPTTIYIVVYFQRNPLRKGGLRSTVRLRLQFLVTWPLFHLNHPLRTISLHRPRIKLKLPSKHFISLSCFKYILLLRFVPFFMSVISFSTPKLPHSEI